MSETWTTALQFVGVPAISGAVAIYVAKKSNRANEKTATIQDKATEIDGMDRLVHNLETRLERVEDRADKLGQRVQALEDERAWYRSLIRHLVTYIHTLRNIIRSAGLDVPEPPANIDIDNTLGRDF